MMISDVTSSRTAGLPVGCPGGPAGGTEAGGRPGPGLQVGLSHGVRVTARGQRDRRSPGRGARAGRPGGAAGGAKARAPAGPGRIQVFRMSWFGFTGVELELELSRPGPCPGRPGARTDPACRCDSAPLGRASAETRQAGYIGVFVRVPGHQPYGYTT